MSEKTQPMSTKRGKLTAGKARERVASLEESISARQHRLDQLDARLERNDSPDERLLTAKTRLERRLLLEREQLEKLQKLLARDVSQPEESGEYFGSEEIDDLHRSFEEVRQNMVVMQARIDSSEMPRDLTVKLSSFEDRVARREEVDSELFSQVLSLQTALDQERQAMRRLSRRTREQDQSLDALREAVEDSVVATVDLAERLDELEESLSENTDSKGTNGSGGSIAMSGDIEILRELAQDARRGLLDLQKQVMESLAQATREREELRMAQAEFVEKQSRAESLAEDLEDTVVRRLEEAVGSQLVSAVDAQMEVALAARMAQLDMTEIVSKSTTLVAGDQSSLVEQIESALNSRLDDMLASRLETLLAQRLDALLVARLPLTPAEVCDSSAAELSSLLARLAALESAHRDPATVELSPGGPTPAVFAHNGSLRRKVALFGLRPPIQSDG